jgi:hypothetical protein
MSEGQFLGVLLLAFPDIVVGVLKYADGDLE